MTPDPQTEAERLLDELDKSLESIFGLAGHGEIRGGKIAQLRALLAAPKCLTEEEFGKIAYKLVCGCCVDKETHDKIFVAIKEAHQSLLPYLASAQAAQDHEAMEFLESIQHLRLDKFSDIGIVEINDYMTAKTLGFGKTIRAAILSAKEQHEQRK